MSDLCPTSHSSCTSCVKDKSSNGCVWFKSGYGPYYDLCFNRDHLNSIGVVPGRRGYYFSNTDCINGGIADKETIDSIFAELSNESKAAVIIPMIIMFSIYIFNFLWFVCPPFRRRAAWIYDPCLRCMWFTCCFFFPPLGCIFLYCFKRPSNPGTFRNQAPRYNIEPPPGTLVLRTNPVNTDCSESVIVTGVAKTSV